MKLSNKKKNNSYINNNMEDDSKNNGDGTQKENSLRHGIFFRLEPKSHFTCGIAAIMK